MIAGVPFEDGPSGSGGTSSSTSSSSSTEGGAGATSGTGGAAGHGGAMTTSDGGVTTDGGSVCKIGTWKLCYTGSQQTLNKGVCRAGRETCDDKGKYGVCKDETLPSVEICDGIDNDCDGVVDNGCQCKDGVQQACYSGPGGTSGIGACHNGLQTCTSGVWGACDGEVTPIAEICDGVDNDCNNAVDDGFGQTTCGLGPCTVTVQNCVSGKPQQCTPLAGSVEVCDGIDNDCNGQTDEGCKCKNGDTQQCYDGPAGTNGVGVCHEGMQTCTNGAWPACEGEVMPTNEICNGADDDCDNVVDNELGSSTCGLGPCKVTVQNCIAGTLQQCIPLQGTPEVCDGIDNDCNGKTDEGCLCKDGDTQSCYDGPGGTMNVGLCKGGTQTCNLAGNFGLCVGEITPTTEICDGADNDCNGKIDENLGSSTCGLGPCKVTVQNCVAGQSQQCTPLAGSPEICDGIDNDCDGVIDNGCPCTVGSKQDCYNGPAGTKNVGICKSGTQTCQPGGWGICTGEILPSTEICNGADDNCNGQTDENLGQTTCGIGLCQNTMQNCSGGKPQQCVPKQGDPETCNGIDDDCDGIVDNGCIGCADGSIEQVYSPTMHGCDGSVAQCNANALCKAGYHLCTFSEYVTKGGTSTPPSAQRWIASCLRESCGAIHTASNNVCGNCSFSGGSVVPVSWDCGQNLIGPDGNCNMGVMSYSQKIILGDVQGTCAFNVMSSPNNPGGAMCCVN